MTPPIEYSSRVYITTQWWMFSRVKDLIMTCEQVELYYEPASSPGEIASLAGALQSSQGYDQAHYPPQYSYAKTSAEFCPLCLQILY